MIVIFSKYDLIEFQFPNRMFNVLVYSLPNLELQNYKPAVKGPLWSLLKVISK